VCHAALLINSLPAVLPFGEISALGALSWNSLLLPILPVHAAAPSVDIPEDFS